MNQYILSYKLPTWNICDAQELNLVDVDDVRVMELLELVDHHQGEVMLTDMPHMITVYCYAHAGHSYPPREPEKSSYIYQKVLGIQEPDESLYKYHNVMKIMEFNLDSLS